MGCAAVAIIAIIGLGIFARLWLRERSNAHACINRCADLHVEFGIYKGRTEKHQKELEAEIQRLRKIPVVAQSKRTDPEVIRATSPAQVRQLTEAAFGKWPAEEKKTVNEDE